MAVHQGGCLCGDVRYETEGAPIRTTVCHCLFCQKVTGTAYMVEAIYPIGALRVTKGTPGIYVHRSAGSGKKVNLHFCPRCATKTHLTFERMPDLCGVYAGTYDDPHWNTVTPETSRHIFLSVARPDTVIPAGFTTFAEQSVTLDGTPEKATVFDAPHVVGPHR